MPHGTNIVAKKGLYLRFISFDRRALEGVVIHTPTCKTHRPAVLRLGNALSLCSSHSGFVVRSTVTQLMGIFTVGSPLAGTFLESCREIGPFVLLVESVTL